MSSPTVDDPSSDSTRPFHTQPIAEVLIGLDVDAVSGLTDEEVGRRLIAGGRNELVAQAGVGPWRIFLSQFTEVMVIVLIIAAAVAMAIGDVNDAVVILVIVVLNAALGFFQEYRAERAIQALKLMAVPVVRVRRDGHVADVPAVDLVSGDIVLLEAGSVVPADARLVEATSLQVAEAALTGEAYPSAKTTSVLDDEHLNLGDRHNMVYMGTSVTHGKGTAVVVATGMATELGNIAELLQSIGRTTTPLQRRMAQLGKGLAIAAVGIVSVVFVLGLWRGEELEVMFLTAISLAVAAVPEGLPAVVTIALSLGAQRLLKREVLIRKLPAVETLGSVTVICSDKTGTITENRMVATEIAADEGVRELVDVAVDDKASVLTATRLALTGVALCNDCVLTTEETNPNLGDPTEVALGVAAANSGVAKDLVDSAWPRVAEAPFTSERKRMTTVHEVPERFRQQIGSEWVAFTKGAPDGLIELSDHLWLKEGPVELTAGLRRSTVETNEHLAMAGRRVLAVALRPLAVRPTDDEVEELEQSLTMLGLVTLVDPPRAEVPAAVRACRRAGIRPVMITGDHPLTARRIAGDVGISTDGRVVTGSDLSQMEDDELATIVAEASVYARVSPEHKLRIVEALQAQGHVVAMTGDGVNDAPALRKADIGVAMGITGTDVSKEAGGMVLLDDNFATIVKAVREGRTIYDNIRKFIKYTMTSNSGEIYTMLLAPLFGLPLPLTAIQILWVNLVTDGLPGLAMSFEPSERDVMERDPYLPSENIFGRGMARHILWVGLLMGLVSLLSGFFYFNADNPDWQTIIFTVLTLSQMGQAMSVRSDRESLFTLGLRSNKPLLGAVLVTLALQLLVIYWGPLQRVFGTEPLSVLELGVAVATATIVFWAVELEKLVRRRRHARSGPADAAAVVPGHTDS